MSARSPLPITHSAHNAAVGPLRGIFPRSGFLLRGAGCGAEKDAFSVGNSAFCPHDAAAIAHTFQKRRALRLSCRLPPSPLSPHFIINPHDSVMKFKYAAMVFSQKDETKRSFLF